MHFTDTCNGNLTFTRSRHYVHIHSMANPKWWLLHMCFGACKKVQKFHAMQTMMLPGTYWALVESILYSSWYLDAAHMDTDKHKLGKKRGQESRKGKERGKSKKRLPLQFFPPFTCILSQNAVIFELHSGESEQQESVLQESPKWDLIIH